MPTISLRLTEELARRLDGICAARGYGPSRSTVIRELIQREFDAALAREGAAKSRARLDARREALIARHKPKPAKSRPSLPGYCAECGKPGAWGAICDCPGAAWEDGRPRPTWRAWDGDEWIGKCQADT